MAERQGQRLGGTSPRAELDRLADSALRPSSLLRAALISDHGPYGREFAREYRSWLHRRPDTTSATLCTSTLP
jgi:hypothetical protein